MEYPAGVGLPHPRRADGPVRGHPGLYGAGGQGAHPASGVLPLQQHHRFTSIEALGRQVLNNPLRYEDSRFSMDFTDLEERAREAKLFVFCSPHNPAGRVWTREELARTEEICRKNNLLVFSDEIHSDIVYQPARHLLFPSLSDWSRENCILAMSPSKTFNIAGLEASFITIPNQERRERYQHFLRYGLHVANCNTFGLAAAQAAYQRGGPW